MRQSALTLTLSRKRERGQHAEPLLHCSLSILTTASSRRTPGSTRAAARIDHQWIPAFAGMTAERLSAPEAAEPTP